VGSDACGTTYVPELCSYQKADSSVIATAEVNPQTIDDIPDDEALSKEVNALNLGGRPSTEAGIPDMDDIPDMEEDDLEGSSAAVVAKPAALPV